MPSAVHERATRAPREMPLRRLRKHALLTPLCAASTLAMAVPPAAASTACEALARSALPDTTIESAQSIAAGSYQPPGSRVTLKDLPAFCRIVGTVSPAPGSKIG